MNPEKRAKLKRKESRIQTRLTKVLKDLAKGKDSRERRNLSLKLFRVQLRLYNPCLYRKTFKPKTK
jgi:hypothetical protein